MRGAMLKIASVESSQPSSVLCIEGRIVGPWVEELRRSCERALASAAVVTLDLAEVSFVDRSGIALLRGLEARGVRLVNCSGFVAEQLKG